MTNWALTSALARATLTVQQLADHCGVDVKTAERWVQHEERLPHARHRRAVATLVGVDEAVLWPDTIRTNIKTGTDREVVATYPYRSACPKSVWRKLVTTASEELTFAGYTCYFLWLEIPNFRNLLRRKAERGCDVKFLIGDPDGEVTRRREETENVPLTVGTRIRVTLDELAKLSDTPGIEARFSEQHVAMSIFLFDKDMLVTPHLADLVGHDSPLFHIRRNQPDGLYDRFAYHAATLWDAARPVV